jgi:hypothetical protein
MKKIISLLLLLISVGIFCWYSSYTKQWPFDYHIAQFVGYFLYWSIALFFVSLFAFVLNNKKYKIWLLITSVYVFLSILIAYMVGDGNSAIISFDGKDLIWIFIGLYSFVSIIFFIILLFKNKKQSTLVE